MVGTSALRAIVDDRGIKIFQGERELDPEKDFTIAATSDLRTAYIRFGDALFVGWQARRRGSRDSERAMSPRQMIKRLAARINCRSMYAWASSFAKLPTYRGK